MAASKRDILIAILGDSSNFAKASKKAGDSTDSLTGAVQKLGRQIMSVYAAKQVVDFAGAAVRAAMDDAAAQQVLATTLRNTTGATDDQIRSIEEWITKTSHATGILDDDLRPALSSLVRVTNDQTKAQGLLQLAMDVSRGTGKDLTTVADAIAKAYAGNTTALGRLVPGIKKAGDGTLTWAEAQQRLNDQFKGQAAAYAETNAGKLEKLNAQYQDMKETVGQALLPVMTQLVAIVSTVFAWFNDLDEEQQQLIITLGVLAGGVYVAGTAIAALQASMTALGVTSATAVPMLIGVAAAVTAVIAAMEIFGTEESNATKRSKELTTATLTAAKSIDVKTVALLSAADAAGKYGDALFAEVEKKAYDTVAADEDLRKSLDEVGISMDDVVQASHDTAKANELLARAQAYAAKHGVDLDDALEDVLHGTDNANAGLAKLVLMLNTSGAASSKSTEQLVDLVKAGDATAAAALKSSEAWGSLAPEVQAAAQAALDAAAAEDQLATDLGPANEMIDTQKSKVEDLKASFEGLLGVLDTNDAYRNAEDALDDLEEAATAAWVANTTGAKDAAEKNRAYQQALDDAKRKLIDYATKVGNLPEERVTEILADVDNMSLGEVRATLAELEKARKVTFTIDVKDGKTILKGSNGQQIGFAWTAEGGYFNQPEVRGIGEAGPEAVLPLSRPGRLAELLADPRIGGPVAAALPAISAAGGRHGSVFEEHIHVHLQVAGSVIAERDLQQVVAAGVREANRRQGRDTLRGARVPV